MNENKFDELLVPLFDWLQQSLPLYWLVLAIFFAVLVLLIVRTRGNKQIHRLNEQREQLAIQQATNSQRIESVDAENHRLTTLAGSNQERILQLEKDRLNDQVRLQSEQEKITELKQSFEKQKLTFEDQFKVLSEKIMKEREQELSQRNKEGVSAMLKPLQEQIQGFQKRVDQVHKESLEGNTHLRSEIESVMKMGIQMRDEASNLTTALKGDAQQRGAWGEAQLERTLELSGLISGDHYEKQNAFTDEQGKRKQTDYLIKLPGDKCLIIDSKVSLNAYEQACSGDPEQQDMAMKLHVSAVRRHIDDLAGKDYANLSAIHSPDFVLMFMPIEPAYIEAMKHDAELFAYGYQKNIILVSHTTLIPILRTVANLWMLERSNKEARQLGDAANDIFNAVANVSQRLHKLGNTLGTVSNHYNDAITALAGKQGLQGKVKRFSELSNKANKDMPELEHKHHDFETSRLEIEALPHDAKD